MPLSTCVHFCGFRYGREEFNPYENYVTALVRGESLAGARSRFHDFLQHYRPAHFGAALGLVLEREYPLWSYPWMGPGGGDGWCARPEDCPDVLTHFSAAGIPRGLVEQEYRWLEGALASIRNHGYQPRRFCSIIETRRLLRADGTAVHLVLDGNHRVAALAAIGYGLVAVRHLPWQTVREAHYAHWPQVRNGAYTAADARQIFAVYFNGNHSSRTTDIAAPIVPA